MTVTLTWTPGAATMWMNAYSTYTLGQSVTTNWIGDVGGNTNGDVSPQSMGISVAAGASIDVVVMSIGQWTSTTPESDPYTLTVSSTSSSSIGCIRPTNVLASLVNPTDPGQATTFSATLSGPPGLAVPTGSVSFLYGSAVIGNSMVNGAGVGSTTAGFVVPGDYAITASYGGDNLYANSISAPLTQTVNAIDAGAGEGEGGAADSGQDDSSLEDGSVDDGADSDGAALDSDIDGSAAADSAVADSAMIADSTIADSAIADSAVVDSTTADSGIDVDSAVADSGRADSSVSVLPDSGTIDSGAGDAAVADAAAGENAGSATGSDNGGCSCRVGPAAAPGSAIMVVGLGVVALSARRRRKKRHADTITSP